MQKLTVFTMAVLLLALGVYILTAAQTLIIPLVIAFVISYLIIIIAQGIERTQFLGLSLPGMLIYPTTFIFLFALTISFFLFLSRNVGFLVAQAPVYQEKLQALIDKIYLTLHIKPPPDFSQFFANFDLINLMTKIVGMLTDFAGYAGMIFIYVIFFLIEHTYFEQKLNALCKTKTERDSVLGIIQKINRQIKSYLRLKTFLSVVTATMSYLVLYAVGVDFAEFWAFLIFMLNYIPTIGSIIATIFPCVLTILQFGAWAPFLVTSVSLVSIQFLIGNVLEPRVMGKSFNLSGLFILLFLAIWGAIWGVIGMFLCVPIMVIVTIILANFPETRPIAIFLSQDGEID